MNDYKELIGNLKYLSDAVRYPIVNELHAGSLMENAADAIEQLVTDRNAARNELCGYCGQYKEAHNGACDGCKWRDG